MHRDRRLAENQTGKRRVVVIMREPSGITLPFVFKSEAQSISTIAQRVHPEATIHADQAAGWDVLHERLLTEADQSRRMLFGRKRDLTTAYRNAFGVG